MWLRLRPLPIFGYMPKKIKACRKAKTGGARFDSRPAVADVIHYFNSVRPLRKLGAKPPFNFALISRFNSLFLSTIYCLLSK